MHSELPVSEPIIEPSPTAAVDEGAIHAPPNSVWPLGEGPWRWVDRIAAKFPRAINWLWLSRQGRYTLAGGWNTVIGTLIFITLCWFVAKFTSFTVKTPTTHVMIIGACSHMLAVGQAYLIQRTIVFRLKTSPNWLEYFHFNVGYLGTLAMSLALLGVLVGHFQLSPYYAQAGIAIFGAVVGYLFHSRISFADKKKKAK